MNAITEAQRAQFDRDGFFVLEDYFATDEIDAITVAIDRHTERHNAQLSAGGTEGISRPNEIQFTAFLAENDDTIRAFASQERLAALAVALLGPDVRLYWNQAVYKHPETPRPFPWHQDNGYTPVEPEQYLTCWLALSDATIENGCIWALPGSHRQGTLPHRDSDIGRVGYDGPEPGVPVPLRKGSMAVFSSLLLHKSGPNLTSSEIRKAYILQYCPADARNGVTGALFADRILVTRAGRVVNGPSRVAGD